MSLSQNIYLPENLLEKGELLGYEYVITHNGGGSRCGYVKVNPGHPWHGRDFASINCEVHGDLTFSEPSISSGEDGGWWVGFDCAHPFDMPDPDLPYDSKLFKQERMSFFERISEGFNGNQLKTHLWTQDEVRDECMRVAVQAEKAAAR